MWSVDRLALSSSNYEVNPTIVRDGLVGKLQGVSSSYIGILSNDTKLQYSLYRAAGSPGSLVGISGGLTSSSLDKSFNLLI